MTNADGAVITFYSYKGGTGRSMAVANIGVLLAQAGAKVLLIDWDLDAPGLHRYFRGHLSDGEDALTKRPGLIELFIALERRNAAIGTQRDDDDTAAIAMADVDLRDYILDTDIPKLWLLKAGRFDKDFDSRVNKFRWQRLFGKSPYLFQFLGRELTGQFDYVLIDSRTGTNDISGICTSLLPDKLVLVFTPNRQSVQGVLEVGRRASLYRKQSTDLRPLQLFPLPSRVEASEPTLLSAWRKGAPSLAGYQPQFENLFREIYGLGEVDLQAYFDEVQIQHVPVYAYGEEIAVLNDGSDRLSLSRSYESFVRYLDDFETVLKEGIATPKGPNTMVRASLAGPGAEQVDPIDAAEQISRGKDLARLRGLLLQARRYIIEEWPKLAAQGGDTNAQIARNDIYDFCLPYVRRFQPDVVRIEAFALSLIESGAGEYLESFRRLIEEWIGISQVLPNGINFRPLRSAPELMATRLLMTMGAKGADNLDFDIMELLLNRPIFIRSKYTSEQAAKMLYEHKELYFADAFLGYSDVTIRYLIEEPWESQHITELFASRSAYREGLAVFLFLLALQAVAHGAEFYPAFKLIPESRNSIQVFVSRLQKDTFLLGNLSRLLGELPSELRTKWPDWSSKLNSEPSGNERYFDTWGIPTSI